MSILRLKDVAQEYRRMPASKIDDSCWSTLHVLLEIVFSTLHLICSDFPKCLLAEIATVIFEAKRRTAIFSGKTNWPGPSPARHIWRRWRHSATLEAARWCRGRMKGEPGCTLCGNMFKVVIDSQVLTCIESNLLDYRNHVLWEQR